MSALPPPPLSVTRVGPVVLVRVAGDVDLASAEELETGIRDRAEGAPAVVLDLSAVTFLDSAGLRLLDHVVAGCDRRRTAVRLVAPPGSATRLPLDLCGFRPGLVTDGVAEALADLPRAGRPEA